MRKRLIAIGIVAVAAVTCGPVAQAEDFYATPLSHGPPTNLPGQHVIPGADLAIGVADSVTRPILQPVLTPDGTGPTAATPGPRVHRHHGHHRSVAPARVTRKETGPS